MEAAPLLQRSKAGAAHVWEVCRPYFPLSLALLNVCACILTAACFIYVAGNFDSYVYNCAGILGGVATLGVLANTFHLGSAGYMLSQVETPTHAHTHTHTRTGAGAVAGSGGKVATAGADLSGVHVLLDDGHATAGAAAPLVDKAESEDTALHARAHTHTHTRMCERRCTRERALTYSACGGCVLTVGVTYVFAIIAVWLHTTTIANTVDTISIPGLHAPVTVSRDDAFVPHIFAQDAHDVFMAQGYVHAQMRLWQMEFNRRVGGGRLAEVAGEAALDIDRTMRTLGLYEAAQNVYQHLKPSTQQALDAYAAGVNAYISQANSGKEALPFEFRVLGFKPAPWQPADSLVWAKVMSYDLSGNMDVELSRYKLFSVQGLSESRVDALIPPFDMSRFPTVLSSPDITPPYSPNSLHQAAGGLADGIRSALQHARSVEQQALRDATRAAPEMAAMLRAQQKKAAPGACDGSVLGDITAKSSMSRGFSGVPHAVFRSSSRYGASNNWVVGGSRTKSGKPLLCNDPHLRLMAPSIWFLTHLSTADGAIDAIGATFPSLPGIVLGHNQDIAWAVTNTGADVQDTYIIYENPANANEYLWEGAYVAMNVTTEPLPVKGRHPESITIRKTRHGPIITDNGFITGYNVPLALRWTSIDPTIPDTTMDAFLDIMVAKNYSDFRNALRRYIAPSQNFIFADIQGNIGYQMPGYIPTRNAAVGHTGKWPAPGNSSAYEWVSVIDFDSLPRTYNPPEGFVVSANNRVTPPDFPLEVSADWDAGSDGYRAERIRDMVMAAGSGGHTADTMAAIQEDYQSYVARDMLAIAANASASLFTPRALGLRTRLLAWNQVMSIGSQEATLLSALVVQLGTLPSLETTTDNWDNFVYLYNALVSDTQQGTDPACTAKGFSSCSAFLADAFDRIAAQYGLDGNGNGNAPRWGIDVHQAVFAHQILGKSPLACLANRVTQHGGDDSTVNVGHFDWDDSSFPQVSGPSYRHIVDLSNLDGSRFINPVGQDGAVFGKHYGDLVTPWSRGTYLNMVTSAAARAAMHMTNQTFQPA